VTNTSPRLACFLLTLLVGGCGGGPDTRCNGHDELCDRRYDEVTYAATHNAFAVKGTYAASNQTRTVLVQLEEGVRGLMLDTHYNAQDVPSYCHGPCAIGQEPLVDGLRVIRDFLDENPREVVTIIFESYVSSADTAAAFEASGLIEFVRRQPLNQPWPTLREMIETNQRLVVLTDAGFGDYDWYLEQFAYGFQNDYAAESAADFTCEADRGEESNSLFIMNHFLTRIFGQEELAAMVNPYDVLAPRVAQCWTETGKRPNFVTVDFYEIGDLLRVVDEMNGVADSGVTITGP
jgi:hypothetical protein